MRHKPILILIMGGGLLLALLLVWGVLIEPRTIDRVHVTVRIPGLPERWNGKRIAAIADLQIGMWFDNQETVRRIIEELDQERPAAVLICGDFIYHPTEEGEEEEKAKAREEFEAEDATEARTLIRKVTGFLDPLIRAGLPVYAVLGNHDYAMQTRHALKLDWVADELTAALENNGVTVLRNRSIPLGSPSGPATDQAPDPPLHLVGIGPAYPGEDHVAQAFEGLAEDTPRLVLLHNPQTFSRIPAGQAPFAIAGHTHGGQIRIPLLPSWSWISIVMEGEVHTDGWIKNFGKPGNHLYVNRGIGFSRFPIRINCPPEITYLTLTRDSFAAVHLG